MPDVWMVLLLGLGLVVVGITAGILLGRLFAPPGSAGDARDKREQAKRVRSRVELLHAEVGAYERERRR